MDSTDVRFVALFVLLGGVAACAPSAPGSGANTPAAPTGKAVPAVATGNACDRKLLRADDIAGILSQPVTGTKPLKGDAQTCYFITATADAGGPELMVTLRPGMGIATIGTFTSGHMNEYAKWKPVSGIGDEAVWLPDLHEINARKDNLLCDIHAEGMSEELRKGGETVQQQKLGALCNKIFAASNLPASATPAAAAAPIHAVSGGNVLDTACDKEIAPADVADILTASVTRQPGYNPQSCSYHAAAGATVTISLASGDEGKFAWDVASNPANGRMQALPATGDSALQGRDGTLVVARKGDLVCSIDITGTDSAEGMNVVTKARGEELAKKLAALCGKVFAAR
jgi:hypothetical protein